MVEKPISDMKMMESRRFSLDFYAAIFLTIVLITIYRLGIHISIPFVNYEAYREYFNIIESTGLVPDHIFSIFSLGIMPYVSAYVLVEILSLFISPLKNLRKGDLSSRRKLKGIALFFTLLLGLIQGNSLIHGLKEMALKNGNKLLEINSNFDHFLLLGILVGGVFLLILICELISKYGFGHGISIILLSGICADFFNNFNEYILISEVIGFREYFISLCAFFSIIYLSVILLKTKVSMNVSHEGSDKPLNCFQLNLCPSATVALTFATSLIMIPATLTNLSGIGEGLTEMLSPGSFIYNLLLVIFVSLFSYFFAWLFFHPKRRLEKMKLRGWEFENIEVPNEKYLLNKIFIYTLPWTAFLCLLAIVPNILIMGFNIPFYIGGASALLVAAIGLDLWNRYKFYKTTSQKPIKIAEFHDIYDATMIHNHLKDIGISCHLQGFYHRHLLYFFGPHVEICLMVSIADKKTAQELIIKNYGGLGL